MNRLDINKSHTQTHKNDHRDCAKYCNTFAQHFKTPVVISVSYPVLFRYACQAPVPLSIFRSNSKFDENSERSSFKYIRPITTIFCTRHDSDTVVTCAKYRCDRPRIFYTRVFWIFIEFDRNMLSGTGAWWSSVIVERQHRRITYSRLNEQLAHEVCGNFDEG